MDILEEIKNRVSMRDLLESYGIYPVRGTNIYKCCFHDDKSPSANIIRGCEKFHCFMENRTWDLFDFVQEYERCDFKTAIKILDTKFNLGVVGNLTHKEKLEIARKKKMRETEKAEKLQMERFEKRVLNEITQQIRLWEQVEKASHITKGQYRNAKWELEQLFFLSIKEQRRLLWLYNNIAELEHEVCEYDLKYGCDKLLLLGKIKKGEIAI